MAGGLAMAGVGAGLQLLNAYNARQREQQAEAEANRLSTIPITKYAPTEQLLDQNRIASNQVANPQGYTAPQRGRFETRLANILATQKYNADRVGGGGTARAISTLGNAAATAAEGDFAANDANLALTNKNAGMNRLMAITNKIQSLDDQNKQVELQRRLLAEQAAGRGIQTNRDMWQGTLGAIGSDLVGAGLTKMLMPTTPTVAGTAKTIPNARVNPRFTEYMPPNFTSADINFTAPTISNMTPHNIIDPNFMPQKRYVRGRNDFSGVNVQDLVYNARTGQYE